MKQLFIGVSIGAIISLTVVKFFYSNNEQANVSTASEKQPLYWVAPMDDNYRRDKPGLSPMGMDLVPYYGDDGSGPDEGQGTIRISSNVINNLGVRTATAEYEALQTKIDTVGYVNYDQDKLVHIHPRVEGWIEKLYVKAIGDPVTKGQALYDIYSPELVNAQEELLLALDRKNSRLISAAENRLIALQLPKEEVVALKKYRKVKQSITFFAPQKGVVENLYIREGFFVKPGTMMISIGDLSEVWVEAEVFERQAGQVKTGTPVTMTLDYLPGKTWQGQVDYIYPTLDAKTRTVKVRLRFKNSDGEFKPNMFAQISIHTSSDEHTLLIPKEALIRTGSQDRVVLALGQGNFKSIEVIIGRIDSDNVEIISGLAEGEKVVSSAQFLLDSESSKSSDFKRMTQDSSVNETVIKSPVSSANTSGTINSLMVAHGMINISRGPIEKWGRPAATVDFITSDTVSLVGFNTGMVVNFTFEVREGNFVITEISQITNSELSDGELTDSDLPAVEHSKH